MPPCAHFVLPLKRVLDPVIKMTFLFSSAAVSAATAPAKPLPITKILASLVCAII